MHIGSEIAERGHDYYLQNKVRYLCIDGTRGRAIVEGTKAYVVEFTYEDGKIRNLVCDCFCSYNCKHEFAAMLQLKETLQAIKENYPDQMGGYFAAVNKAAFFNLAVEGKKSGSFTMGSV